MNDDRFRFDYLTPDFYWLLCSEDLYPQAKKIVDITWNFVCDVRLCRDDEVLLDALGCLDADV